ncbi:malate dehydrogenase [Lachnospiraceae bacterium PF1-21]|uniref:L-lactate dehydrogenase n=1 Tax=Ohessyouella blattaphilus TaxID=2949333 RepID=A0ABT1EGU9_9FIRM|nr:hypothetical protein [Ohessyouella blattaphilus]MCP1108987.1 hypothetical protein [Ohessyouella blattaphilus]MCR8562381.1 hypothetical protein [Ohessyouella blattaphilus]
MKLGVIGGAGLLGSTTAFCVGMRDVLEEIKLLDLKENVLEAHVMDMSQALLPVSKTKVTKADYEDLGDCDIILVTASLPERQVANRNEYLTGNLGVVTPICEKLKAVCKKDAILISATNPVDVFTYVYWKLLGWDKSKVLGFCVNDTLRFKWAIEEVTGKEFSKLDAMCIGEHGDGQVRLYNHVTYDGKPMEISQEERTAIEEATANWFRTWQQLDSKRTTGWTSGVMLADMIEAIATDSKAVIPVSVVMDGFKGYDHVAMGMPGVFSKEGVTKLIDVELTDEGKAQLDKTACKIEDMLKSIDM